MIVTGEGGRNRDLNGTDILNSMGLVVLSTNIHPANSGNDEEDDDGPESICSTEDSLVLSKTNAPNLLVVLSSSNKISTPATLKKRPIELGDADNGTPTICGCSTKRHI